MPVNLVNELLKAKSEITSKEKLFLRYYRKSGNAAWSAERAGYDDATEGGRILEKPAVRGYLACQTVDRSAHRPVTYRDMIFLHERGMECVRVVWKDPASTLRDKAMALEVAGRAVERVAKVEGLLKTDGGMGMLSVTAGGEGAQVKVSMVDMSRLSLEELEQYRDLMEKLAREEEEATTEAAAAPPNLIEAECKVKVKEEETGLLEVEEEEREVDGASGAGDDGGSQA